MTEQGKQDVASYTRMVLTVVLTVVGSWATVRQEIHGYIDSAMEAHAQRMVTRVASLTHGQMLMVMDSVVERSAQHAAQVDQRLRAIEHMAAQPVIHKTVVLAADTAMAARHQAEVMRRMAELERGIEYILDRPGPLTPRHIYSR